MENKKTLELKIIKNDVSKSEIWYIPSIVSRNVDSNDFEYVLANIKDSGEFTNFAGKHAGTVKELTFRSLDPGDLSQAVLNYEEWNKMGRPLKIQETKTYEAAK